MTHQNQQQGFTHPLLELILVMVIAAIIMLTSVNQYRQYQHRKNVTLTKRNIYQLFHSAGLYYQAHCENLQRDLRDTESKQFDPDTLVEEKFLPSKNYIKNLLVPPDYEDKDEDKKDDLTFGILLPPDIHSPNPRPYQLYVRGTFVNDTQLKMYKNLISAGEIDEDEKTITWVKLPGHSLRDFSSGLWQMRAGLHRFKQSQSLEAVECPDFQE